MTIEPRDLGERCAVCGHTYGLHGFIDGRCPGTRVAGEWVPAQTFFKRCPPPTDWPSGERKP
jgi:hypothetical protein